MKYVITLLCAICSFLVPNAMAQALQENEATPSAISEYGAFIIITEVNFKNKETDWAEIYYESPTGKAINLKGISFSDDKIFKKIENDFWLPSKQYATLIFKSETIDATPYLATTHTGLTGTTEQLILYDRNNNIIDAVCWRNSKPTTSEISDLEELYQQNGWNSSDINTCLDSATVKTNNSIARNNFSDTNTATDWAVTSTTTPGTQNNISQNAPEPEPDTKPLTTTKPATTSSSTEITEPDKKITTTITSSSTTTAKTQSTNPTFATLPKSDTPKQTISQPTSTTKKTSTKTTSSTTKKSTTKKSSTFKNGDLSTDIHISEILPNPEKEDTKNEWIELANVGKNDINLGNWLLDDNDKGSKPYTISDTTIITAGSALLIPITESKLSLGNTSDSVRIFNFNNELIDSIEYENAPSGNSYAHIAITNEEETTEENWLWLKNPSPGEPNPSYINITGTIIKEPTFENIPDFEIKNSKGEPLTISFTENVIAGPFAKATFLQGTQIKVTLEKNEDDTYQLRSFEILSSGTEEQNAFPLLPAIIITTICLGGTASLWYWKKVSADKSENEIAGNTLFKTTSNG